MKINYSVLYLIILMSCCLSNLPAQTIKIVPGQDYYNIYSGDPIIYKNSLYINYTAQGPNSLFNHLAKANGNQILSISGPNQDEWGYGGFPIVYSDKLYLAFANNGNSQLAVYDGINITLIPNPDSTLSYLGFPIVYNNKLYLEYFDKNSNTAELFAFDGANFSAIPNPSGYTLNEIVFNSSSTVYRPTTFNDKLYLPYQKGPLVGTFSPPPLVKLGEYDGTTLKLLDSAGVKTYGGSATIYDNKLYFTYGADTINLAEYDGTNPIKIIPNPTKLGYVSIDNPNLIIFHDKLYTLYFNFNSSAGQYVGTLGQYDGTNFTLISNPDLGLGYIGNPIIYKENLYFTYQIPNQNTVLGKFNDIAISTITNPSASYYTGKSTVYNNYLYSDFGPYQATYQYDGISFKVIPSPPNNIAYNGSPIIVHDTLFFGETFFGSGIKNHLAYLSDGVLPVNIVGLSALLKNHDVWLQWQTATEENTSYFTILRSTDGINFSNIGKVAASGNSSLIKNYTYLDANATFQNVSKLFYRLQEVDKDGSGTDSKIEVVNLAKGNSIFSVSPNPTKDFINIFSSNDVTNAQIRITDISGKTLYTTKQNFIAGEQIKIAVSRFSSKILIVNVETVNDHNQFKIVKE